MAVAGEAIAVEVLGIGAKDVADALLANAADGVAPESSLAVLAVGALGVEETFEALARVGVAVAGVVVVPVVATVAGHARTAGDLGVSVVVVGTDGATEAWEKKLGF